MSQDLDLDVDALARSIVDARARREPLPALTDTMALTMDQAYRIQAAVTAIRLADGRRIVGWKLGYTSQAMREQMGVDRVNVGPLTDVMALDDGARVPATAVQPLVEPEVALVMGAPLAPGCDVDDVLAATREARACLEVVDPIWSGRRFRIEDNTADGSSAAFYVLGGPLDATDLPGVHVTLHVDGRPVATGAGADASGHPALGVVELVEHLHRHGHELRPGDVVLTGGLTRAHPLDPGHRISAEFRDPTGTVVVGVER